MARPNIYKKKFILRGYINIWIINAIIMQLLRKRLNNLGNVVNTLKMDKECEYIFYHCLSTLYADIYRGKELVDSYHFQNW